MKIPPRTAVPRDISWMLFNHRILEEAGRETVPLLERLSFLGIYSNNLDEFFRVRVSALNRAVERRESRAKTEEARSTLEEISWLNEGFVREFAETLDDVMSGLAREGISIVPSESVVKEDLEFLRTFYRDKIGGRVFPTWIKELKSFCADDDSVINLAVRLWKTRPVKGKTLARRDYDEALVFIPGGSMCKRFVELPALEEGRHRIMWVDDVVRCCLPVMFPGSHYQAYSAWAFKFTKDADMELDEADGMVSKMERIEEGLRTRRQGDALRIIYDAAMPQDLLRRVLAKFGREVPVVTIAGGRYHNHRDLMAFPHCGRNDLKYPKVPPAVHPELANCFDVALPKKGCTLLPPQESLFGLIRKKDRLVHVPYQSFDSYLRFLNEAAVDPAVTGIRATLYRLASHSKVVHILAAAARNGKRVVVNIELLARFDEESNIAWSRVLREAGAEVLFGVDGLKVHSKLTLVETKKDALAVIGTGNFHEGNAKCYTDLLMFTARKAIVKEVRKVFDFFECPYRPPKFDELLVSPFCLRSGLLALIDNEIRNAKAGRVAWIKMKLNHLVDPEFVGKLYEASAAGVAIRLSIRGCCSLLPGVKGLSENIRVSGIIDQRLEHERIYIFADKGNPRYYLGSADLMPRNLDRRVEVLTPVVRGALKKELDFIVDCALEDNQQARRIGPTGWSRLPEIRSEAPAVRSQEALVNYYADRVRGPRKEK